MPSGLIWSVHMTRIFFPEMYLSDNPKLDTHEDIINPTSHFEFEIDIFILATVSEKLATLWKKINRHTVHYAIPSTNFEVET